MLEKTAPPSARLSDRPDNSKTPNEPLISTTALSYKADGKTLLSAIDLEVRKGQIVTLIGPNGAGKSTLLKLLLGILKPSTGKITRKPNLRIGYVPQKFALDKTMPLTVRRFLSLGNRARPGKSPISQSLSHKNFAQSDIEALKKVGAEHLQERQIAELSGGEFQRVVLARAISNQPELLILDEPVQGVDYSGEAELYKLIENIRNELQCAVVLVSHDLHVVMAASDEVICLNQHICCSGQPETVRLNPEYQRLFGPEAAGAFALYHHVHDHHHDMSGSVCEHDHNHDSQTKDKTAKDKTAKTKTAKDKAAPE